jgi:hypothetical protein
MIDLCKLIWCAFVGLFRSRAALEAEILVLRHQLNVLRRKSRGRLAFSSVDRVVLAGIYALAPNIRDALKIGKSLFGQLSREKSLIAKHCEMKGNSGHTSKANFESDN